MPTNKKTIKPVSKKPASKTSAKITVIKKAAKVSKLVAKKPVVKSTKQSPKKSVKPIKKTAPAKKTAKPVAKKAAPKKVAKPVKKSTPVKKAVKPVAKKAAPKKVAKPVKKSTPVKKAVKSVAKKAESKKPELKPLPKAKNIKVPPPKPVVLPKITATKARKYEPEFTKSVLDQAPQENNGPTMRYSDAELNEFRELIQRKLETAKKELGYLQGLITRKDEMGGDDTDNRYMTMEDGSLSMEREQLSQMASRQITFIDHLEKAMMRIENKTYGICRVTGRLIDKARLRAVPHATLSIEAKMGIAR
jgi:RNA polymerase-binding transcription factor DksA